MYTFDQNQFVMFRVRLKTNIPQKSFLDLGEFLSLLLAHRTIVELRTKRDGIEVFSHLRAADSLHSVTSEALRMKRADVERSIQRFGDDVMVKALVVSEMERIVDMVKNLDPDCSAELVSFEKFPE